ncbi:hypothetical protein [Streptomyces sp. SPB074]|uniref:hypothetical protein n=1 Tax=Streptomyces sp. (strain SPB074) TaxID=465543 RepID=UPI00017F1CB5|nr:hypothetical protein [Streptomyces sp. SPB074]
MAIPTEWTIEHACGHTEARDLTTRPADRRAGFAEWLGTQPCTTCWKTARAAERSKERAAEEKAIEEWAKLHQMPVLHGTERMVPWATRCRHQLLSDAYTALVMERDTTEAEWETVEEAARSVDCAGWWLDQRKADPSDLPELLEAATCAP